MIALPIDEVLPEIVARVRESRALVLEAPPGAGKTTRVPRALLDAGLAERGEIVVLEPRRLAARMAARRVAEELGERPGGTVGYQVRFEDVSGPKTRVRFVTEGLLTRRLVADPMLRGVAAVVLDEFHERHLHGDVALALLRRLQRGARPDLAVVVMSATLDAEPVAAFLGAPRVRSEGRAHPVHVDHLPKPDDRPLASLVATALRDRVREGLHGDVLVFLPGAAEIRKAQEAIAPIACAADLAVFTLHGDLSAEEQDRAVRPCERQKVILSTNVAETSVTIDGVAVVIDGGLARIASHSPWSGLPLLSTDKISRASAAQRAGRAGRTGPGVCTRLYTKADHDARRAFELPEIARMDLAELVLDLRAQGIAEPSAFDWFEAPRPAALAAADQLLSSLGAVAEDGALTPIGRRMSAMPLHPRLSRLVVEGDAYGVGESAATIAALLGERNLRAREGRDSARDAATGPSERPRAPQLWEEARDAGFDRDKLRWMGLDAGAVHAVERAQRQLVRAVGRAGKATRVAATEEEALLQSLLAAYPDRVARRRSVAAHHERTSSGNLILVGGGTAALAETSVVRTAPFLVAVDAESRGVRVLVRLASAIEPEWLLDRYPARVRSADEVSWNDAAERVEGSSRLLYDDLVLDESPAKLDAEAASALLAERALALGPRAFAKDDELDRFLARTAVAAQAGSSVPALGDADAREALVNLCRGRRSFAELRQASLVEALRERLPPRAAAELARLCPERVKLARGREVVVHYEAGKPPSIGSRMQDFFGMKDGPRVADGKVPLVLHLLAPNQRAVQVTQDLAGFWQRHYPSIRKELMRKYPRHAWPESPLAPV